MVISEEEEKCRKNSIQSTKKDKKTIDSSIVKILFISVCLKKLYVIGIM